MSRDTEPPTRITHLSPRHYLRMAKKGARGFQIGNEHGRSTQQEPEPPKKRKKRAVPSVCPERSRRHIYIYPVYPNNPHVSLVHCLVTTQVTPPYIYCYDRTELDPPVILSPHMTLKAYPFRHNDRLNFVMFTAVLLILRRDLAIPTTLRY